MANENDSCRPELQQQDHSTCPATDSLTVDLKVQDGRIRDLALAGDFQLTPDSERHRVISQITSALDGLSIDLAPNALAARVRTAIPYGIGIQVDLPLRIAEAIRQSIGPVPIVPRIGSLTMAQIDALVEPWRKLSWRIIPDSPLSAAQNVALDEVLCENARPVVRFWNWEEPAVVIGRCQSIANEVDRTQLIANGITLVRRFSGGGTMFVQPERTITYSLILPEEAVAGLSIRQSYEVCDAWVIQTLRGLGVDAHHVPVNDIACAYGKIGGAAQARRRGLVLHHTTIAYDMNMDELASYLRIGRERHASNAIASAAKVVAPLRRQLAIPRVEIVRAMSEHFRSTFGGSVEPLSPGEIARGLNLVQQKYGHPDWTEAFA